VRAAIIASDLRSQARHDAPGEVNAPLSGVFALSGEPTRRRATTNVS